MNHKTIFDHEKLEVYQLELKFVTWVTPLISEIKKNPEAMIREVCDHLDRSSLSMLFNTAEGNGKRQSKQRARFFDDARGSGCECAACLDALVAKGQCANERILEGKQMLLRIVSMLSKLVDRFNDQNNYVREEPAEYEDA